MLPPSPTTGFARLTPWAARAVLGGAAGMTLLLMGIAISPRAIVNCGHRPAEGVGDPALYRAEAERVHAGEAYYDVLAEELPERGYPTRSVFNWRTPLPVWMLGKLPKIGWGKGLLGLLGLALIVASFEAIARDGSVRRAIGTACLLTGPLLLANQDDHFFMPVFWSGALIGLSVAAYGLGRRGWGVGLGLAAIFFRDLALPYGLLAAAMALWGRRWREVAAWATGLAAWAVFFGWHAAQVFPRIAPDAVAHHEGWLQLAGARFVLAAVQMNAYLIVLPQWAAALFFMAAMLGLAGWHTPLGQRTGLTACMFVGAFALVGQPFNQYWGALMAPLLCMGVARAPASLKELCSAAVRAPELAELAGTPESRLGSR